MDKKPLCSPISVTATGLKALSCGTTFELHASLANDFVEAHIFVFYKLMIVVSTCLVFNYVAIITVNM